MTTTTFLPMTTHRALVDALVAAATSLTDLPELVDRNEIVIALGERGDIWPDCIREDCEA
jgi:hypothetical protein